MAEGRFKTEEELPEQTLGHIQHTCEALSAAHIDAHHQCWRLIHGELARLAAPGWKFLCVSGEKCLQTIWDEITLSLEEFVHKIEVYDINQDPYQYEVYPQGATG